MANVMVKLISLMMDKIYINLLLTTFTGNVGLLHSDSGVLCMKSNVGKFLKSRMLDAHDRCSAGN